jgi:wyosine [tRNA(Phe)-imidazoG37] synthetase (radical SAM superfamily)
MLTISDHRRDRAGLIYVYPVISRRAGGVSVGINLNTNNACNWACLYCQVENLTRGGPPPVDLDRLEDELSSFLREVIDGDFMPKNVPPDMQKLVDLAFSGNGEPTSSSVFAESLARVETVLQRVGLLHKLPVRLITNGSLLHRASVQAAIAHLNALSGEVWFKVDRGDAAEVRLINDVPMDIGKVRQNLAVCASLAPTWVQTCWFALDGQEPSAFSRQAYCDLLKPLSGALAGIHLYGLARPSMQPAASRLSALSPDRLTAFAAEIQEKTGIRVLVSP